MPIGYIGSQMVDFEKARNACENASSHVVELFDNFLMHYVARQENIEREMDVGLAPWAHIVRETASQEWLNNLKAQYIAHRLFKGGGLIRRYLQHSALQQLEADQRRFLEFQLDHPWRFSFSIVTDTPAPDFFVMEDAFTGDRYLLQSAGLTSKLAEMSVSLWFNLIAFNGVCWQTFGPIVPFAGFQSDDIFFFATERNKTINSVEALMKDVEANPFPYAMLVSGAQLPQVISGADALVMVLSDYSVSSFSSDRLAGKFSAEYNKSVYKLSLKGMDEPPHFAVAYYDEKHTQMVLTAMTDRGYSGLVKALKPFFPEIEDEPQVRVSPAMVAHAGHMLRKKIVLHPYEPLFAKKVKEEDRQEIRKINKILAQVVKDINGGIKPDIDALARKQGLDPLMLRRLVDGATERMRRLRGEK